MGDNVSRERMTWKQRAANVATLTDGTADPIARVLRQRMIAYHLNGFRQPTKTTKLAIEGLERILGGQHES